MNRRKLKIDIKKFKILKQIGSGSYGSVYSVQNKSTKEIYAAKVINFQGDKNTYKKMINREIGNLIRCQHSTIIKFVGYSLKDFLKQDNVTIFTELASKGSLAKILQDIQCSLAEHEYDNTTRQKILIGIARGMMHLHQHQTIHRDLKPGNILLDDDFNPYITDFGLSKLYKSNTTMNKTQTICGTSIYMAPEIIENKPYNYKADVYSFGILMYEVVTDSIPYPMYQKNKMSEIDFIYKVLHENYRPKFEFPIKKSIKKLIEQCWSQNADERPTFEEIFNKLAFNIEDSFFENEEEDNNDDDIDYYLDNVDVDYILTYAEMISENRRNEINNNQKDDLFNDKMEEMEKKIKSFEKSNKNIKKQYEDACEKIESFQEKIDALTKKTKKLEKENKTLKDNNNELNANLDEIKKKLEKIENIINTQNKESDEAKIPSINQKEQKKNEIPTTEEIPKEKTYKAPTKKIKNKTKISILKANMEIEGFNAHSLLDQQLVIEKTINESPKSDTNLTILKNINDFILFILDMNQDDNFDFLRISENNSNECLKDISMENQIQIRYNATRFILENDLFKSKDFIEHLLKISNFSVELYYPSSEFDESLEIISQVQKTKLNKMKILVPLCENAYKNNLSLTQVSIPSIITSINESVFEGCKNITEIIIPSSVTSIGKKAFYNCKSLKNISIPSSVVSIGDCAFYACSSITQLTIPSSVKLINFRAFNICSNIVKINLLAQITKLSDDVFSGCFKLIEMTIPSTVKEIGRFAFKECTKLEKVTIPSSVTTIGYEAFQGCSSLKQINIPSSVILIDNGAFLGCRSLTQVTIPSPIKEIKYEVFENCSSLSQVIIPSSVTRIVKDAFKSCISLVQIKIPSSDCIIEENAFPPTTKIIW